MPKKLYIYVLKNKMLTRHNDKADVDEMSLFLWMSVTFLRYLSHLTNYKRCYIINRGILKILTFIG